MKKYLLILGVFSCLLVNAQSKMGDNLGTHKADKDLNMNGNKIISAAQLALGKATFTNSSVQIELGATDKAILINRVSVLSAITTPVNGMLVFNNGDSKFYQYRSGAWETIAALSDISWSNVSGKPSFSLVATSGNYNDLSNKPSLATVATSGQYNDLLGKPSLATVATSGSYTDLSNKPTLATVANTGNYNDLSNKPTIPTLLSQLTNDYGYNRWYDGWVSYPGYDANVIGGSKSGFSYSNNAPWTGPLAHFEASGYGLQLSASYSGGNYISWRTRNGDNGTWNPWREIIHSGNIGSQSVNYANSAGSVSWSNVTSKPSLDFATHRGEGTNYIDYAYAMYDAYRGGWRTSNDLYVAYAYNAGNSATTSQRTFSNVRTDGINRGSYGSVSIAGNSNGWAGVDFTGANATLMVRTTDQYSGLYKNDNSWVWGFDGNGSLVTGTVPWGSVTGKPSFDYATHRGEGSNFVDYSRYVYNNGAYSGSGWVEPSDLGVRYANTAGSTQVWFSQSHPSSYYLVNNWDGSRWNITSNHGAPVRVGYADLAGSVDWSNISSKPSFDYATHRGEGTNYIDYSRYVYNNGAYSGSGWVEPSDLGVRYANSAGSAGQSGWLTSIASNPDNSHPGYGAKIFYSWNTGQANNSSAGYSNGITIGSHPGDQNYGFQIVQNMWDDNTYTRRYSYGWQGWRRLLNDISDPYAANMNQSVRTDGSPTFSTVYTGGWYRSTGVSGWYNETYGGGMYMADASYVRTYGSKHFYCDQNIYAAGDVNAGGDIIGFTSTPSDARLKHNFKRIEDPLSIIRKLNGYTFDWNRNNKRDIGVKAQEVEEVLPEIVKEQKLKFFADDDKKYKTVEYEKIVPVLIEAIKVLEKRVKELEAQKRKKS